MRESPGQAPLGAGFAQGRQGERERLVRCHLWISGIVQGVGFRFFTERVARRLGVSGFACNLPDGRVEVVVEGPRVAVEALMAEVRRGPGGAAVRDVTVAWEQPAGITGFSIR